MRRRTRIVLSTLAVVLLACGDDKPPGAVAPEPCHAQAVYEQAAINHATEQDVRVALLDAAERLVPGLAEGERAAQLRTALRSVQAGGTDAADAACRAIRIAREVLAAQPDVPESRPDRAAIQHALDLAETYYAGPR